MKVHITLEVVFSELPEDVREDLADGINFRADEDREISPDLPAVPTVEEMSPDEIVAAVSEFFGEFGDYDEQSELWAGSDIYGYISEVRVLDATPVAA